MTKQVSNSMICFYHVVDFEYQLIRYTNFVLLDINKNCLAKDGPIALLVSAADVYKVLAKHFFF